MMTYGILLNYMMNDDDDKRETEKPGVHKISCKISRDPGLDLDRGYGYETDVFRLGRTIGFSGTGNSGNSRTERQHSGKSSV